MRQTLTASAIVALASAIHSSNMMQLEAPDMGSDDAIQFIGGFLQNFIGNDYVTEITSCSNIIEDNTTEFQDAIDSLKGDDVLNGVMRITQLVCEWPTILNECATPGTAIADDIEKLGDWANLYDDADQASRLIATRLLANAGDIVEKGLAIENDFNTERYYHAGQELSDMVTLALGPVDGDGRIVANECWRDASLRGIGRGPTECPAGYDNQMGRCFPQCQEGYTGVLGGCYQDCPEGFTVTIDGVQCRKPEGYWRGSYFREAYCEQDGDICEKDDLGLLWHPMCRPGYHGMLGNWCSPDCPAGMADMGLTCGKNVVDRDSTTVLGTAAACEDDEEKSGPLCYPKCEEGFDGTGPVCWGECPIGTTSCGALCMKEGESCLGFVAEQMSLVGQAIQHYAAEEYDQGAIDVAAFAGNFVIPTCSNPNTDIFA